MTTSFKKWRMRFEYAMQPEVFEEGVLEEMLDLLLTGERKKDPEAVRFMMKLTHPQESEALRMYALDLLIRAMFYRELPDPTDQNSLQPYTFQIVAEKDVYFVRDLMECFRSNVLVAPNDLQERIYLFIKLIENVQNGEDSTSQFFELALRYEWEGRLLKNVAPTIEHIKVLAQIACPQVDPYAGTSYVSYQPLVDAWNIHLNNAVLNFEHRSFAASLALKLSVAYRRTSRSFSSTPGQLAGR
ncbi:hypothetical protein COY25_03060 [Candidatus Uhrbacteria bacterium CG_4_10_14_0_2_um_filter_41_7]|nr:MAG: hypothetical protein COV92_01295 [Candidatus Uhrbacteria bacterium CG11_big_fil_rev_8_21_14_0_20_41_9]PIZ53756.1 MAG: hypothetical protein COY25_03060 [Candidatus Uhrbacteria bacterium CG_4_10_14_0_2_um_filter_41_7]